MELGSEFSLSLSDLSFKQNNIFNYLTGYNSAFFFDSGRSALKHIAARMNSKEEILLPEFICESVTDCFRGMKITFYRLNDDFSVDMDDLRDKIGIQTRIVFLMHYFGALQPTHVLQKIKELAEESGCIILEDTTHSIFSKMHTIGDYQICSIRKWMPIPKGGVLYYQDDRLGLADPSYHKATDNDRSCGMILKDLFLRGVLDCNPTYRGIFAACEERLDRQKDILLISDFAEFIASCIDINEIQEKRKRNYRLLHKQLMDLGISPALQLEADDCPFVYPLHVPNRDHLRAYLMDHKIYCAVHWPFDEYQADNRPFAEQNSRELISLPIDQRYDDEHISYLADVISKRGGELQF